MNKKEFKELCKLICFVNVNPNKMLTKTAEHIDFDVYVELSMYFDNPFKEAIIKEIDNNYEN